MISGANIGKQPCIECCHVSSSVFSRPHRVLCRPPCPSNCHIIWPSPTSNPCFVLYHGLVQATADFFVLFLRLALDFGSRAASRRLQRMSLWCAALSFPALRHLVSGVPLRLRETVPLPFGLVLFRSKTTGATKGCSFQKLPTPQASQ